MTLSPQFKRAVSQRLLKANHACMKPKLQGTVIPVYLRNYLLIYRRTRIGVLSIILGRHSTNVPSFIHQFKLDDRIEDDSQFVRN